MASKTAAIDGGNTRMLKEFSSSVATNDLGSSKEKWEGPLWMDLTYLYPFICPSLVNDSPLLPRPEITMHPKHQLNVTTIVEGTSY